MGNLVYYKYAQSLFTDAFAGWERSVDIGFVNVPCAVDCEIIPLMEDRLLAILRETDFDSSRQVIETLAAAVERHRNGAEPNDDLTMMCLQIRGIIKDVKGL